MTRMQVERLLEKAVADALGVSLHAEQPRRRARPRPVLQRAKTARSDHRAMAHA